MKNFYIYVFYFLTNFSTYTKKEDKRIHAIIMLGALFMFNIFILVAISKVVFQYDPIDHFYTENGLVNRFIVIPILTSPIFISIWFFNKKNKDYIKEKILEYKMLDAKLKKRKNKIVIVYLICSILLPIAISFLKFLR